MQLHPFFHRVLLLGPDFQVRKFLGTAFPITPDGGLMTCRHVVDIDKKDDETLVVVDQELDQVFSIEEIKYPRHSDLDIAFIPNAFERPKREFFPILSPELIIMGEDVYSVGFYVSGGGVNVGHFKGNIINFGQADGASEFTLMSLSYAVIEGLSGSPVLTYYNGPKVVGLCHSSVQSRIAAREIVEYQDERRIIQETITRIVELGQAYHANVMIEFLKEVNAQGYVVSSQSVPGIFE